MNAQTLMNIRFRSPDPDGDDGNQNSGEGGGDEPPEDGEGT